MLRLIPFLLMPWRWYPWYRQPRSFGHRLLWRAFWIFVVSGTAIGATFAYREAILLWFFAPAGELLSPFEDNLPIFTEPTGMLTLVVKMCLYAGLFAAIPTAVVGFYHMGHSKLPMRLRLWAMGIALSVVLLSIAAVMFVYYVILPNGVPFLLNFGGNVAHAVIDITAYVSLALTLMFWVTVFFQTPLLMFGATTLGIIPYRRFRSVQKYVPWIAGVLGALITPGFDLINALMVAAPIYALYHLGLLASWAARPEEGDYLWLRSIGSAIKRFYRRVRAVVTSPVTLTRWAYRKVLRK